jgi:hypothetical protein
MGLEERRRIKELQDVTLPGRVKEIEEICGTAGGGPRSLKLIRLRNVSDNEIRDVLMVKL